MDEDESEDVVMKKPAVKKRPAGAMKRPAAVKPSMKRPAAAKIKFITMAAVFSHLKTIGTSMSRNGFTSKAYQAARTIKLRNGASAAAAKSAARAAYKKACELYDGL